MLLSSVGSDLIGEQILNELLTIFKRKIYHRSIIIPKLALGATSLALRKIYISVKASS